ncbi:O-methyltransferase [Haloparvum sedimenti]|uniref:O-methyltransferase n=1 Tax=Haloparvum sedimenti TaxID=1678448 RepID=UPI00071E99C2|nr:O-methyltransferase [Haloparvum sedimenti]
MDVLPDHTERFLAATAQSHTDVQAEMADLAADQGFPIIGPAAGGVLRTLARLTDAATVFEFGSGFGYSASWFVRGGADRVVCTEFDADEAETGANFMVEAGWDDRVTFAVGDALETVADYDGPFDAVLIDNEKHRYVEAFEATKPRLADGGVVVADNMMEGPIDLGDLLAYVEEGVALPPGDKETRGIAEYIDTVRADDAFETVLLPVGSGIAVSTHVG